MILLSTATGWDAFEVKSLGGKVTVARQPQPLLLVHIL